MANDANSGTPSYQPALQRVQAENRELKQFIAWEDELFSNPHISGNHKIILRATHRAVQHGKKRDEQGRTHVAIWAIAEQSGVSDDTVRRGLEFFQTCGVVTDRETKPEPDTRTGELKSRVYISLDDEKVDHPKEVSVDEEKLTKPKDITPPEPRKHGGDRYTCQKCSERGCTCKGNKVKIRTRRTLVCKCCNHEVELDTTERDLSPDPHGVMPDTSNTCTNGSINEKQLAFTLNEAFAQSKEGTNSIRTHKPDDQVPQKQVASTAHASIEGHEHQGADWQVADAQTEEGTNSTCIHDQNEQNAQKQVASTPNEAFAPTQQGGAPNGSATSNLRPLLKPDSPPMGMDVTVPQVAGRQNASRSCHHEDDQEPEGHLAFPRGVCTGYPLPDLGVGVPTSPVEGRSSCQPRQDDQAPNMQVAFEENGSCSRTQEDDQTTDRQDAFANQKDGVCQTDGIDTSAQTKDVCLADTPITTNESGICLTPTDVTDAGIGALPGFPSSGIDTEKPDAFLTVPVSSRSSASGVSTTTDPLTGDLHAAAELLLALSGPTPKHIWMEPGGDAKYKTAHRPLTLSDILSHLKGGKARGALCCYPDNQTHGMCWDTDDTGQDDGWQILQESMRVLKDAGYLPILEPSPAGRGGHSWIIFDDLVDAGQARAHVLELAPALATFKEYWPGPKGSEPQWNKVRLPGGRYVRPGVNAWCHLVSDGETSTNGLEAARLLLQHQTPARIVPAITPRQNDEQTREDHFVDTNKPIPARREDHVGDAPKLLSQRGEATHSGLASSPTSLSHAEVDQAWLARYDTPEGKRLWFAFTSRYVANWYNARHGVEDLLPSEDNGYGLASWRGERTASVKKDGKRERWTDFGASARRDDGSPDSGDALELQVRLSGTPKPEVLRQAGRELKQQAQTELEGAARSGQVLPTWLEEIITPAGRRQYARLAEQAGHIEQARAARAKADQIEQAEARASADNPENFGAQTDAATPTKSVTVPGQDACDTGKGRFQIAVKEGDARSAPTGGLPGFSSSGTDTDQESKMLPRRQLPNSASAVPLGTTNVSDATDAQDAPVPTNGTTVPPHSQAESVLHALVECYHLQRGEPCSKCGCELYRDLVGSPHCCRCYPPRGYYQYKNTVDWLYPRKPRL